MHLNSLVPFGSADTFSPSDRRKNFQRLLKEQCPAPPRIAPLRLQEYIRLFMLKAVSGCSAPSSFSLSRNVSRISCSASSSVILPGKTHWLGEIASRRQFHNAPHHIFLYICERIAIDFFRFVVAFPARPTRPHKRRHPRGASRDVRT